MIYYRGYLIGFTTKWAIRPTLQTFRIGTRFFNPIFQFNNFIIAKEW